MKRRLSLLALLVAIPAAASAQGDDRAYCEQIGALAARYTGGAGGDGRLAPDLNVLGAIEDCKKGRTEKSIPYLEKRLRDQHITVPPRR